MRIGIVSNNKFKNKIFEDNLLKKQLLKNKIDCEIISWEEENDYSLYDALILKSVWGYQNNYNNFKNWLLKLKENNIKIFNDPNLILNNIKKNIQFDILNKYNLDTVDTIFTRDINEVLKHNNKIVKPSISGSGENTFFINDLTNNNISKLKKLLNNNDLYFMIQPYIKEIKNGEYSFIFINHELSHIMKRYPGIFEMKKKPEIIDKVDGNLLKFAKNIESLYEFNDYLYIRIDLVITNKPLIMEIELAEPDLLTKYLNEEKQEEVSKKLVLEMKRRINK